MTKDQSTELQSKSQLRQFKLKTHQMTRGQSTLVQSFQISIWWCKRERRKIAWSEWKARKMKASLSRMSMTPSTRWWIEWKKRLMLIKVTFYSNFFNQSVSESNINRAPGFRKMKMLKEVVKNITKSDLNEVLVEHGIMSALADWISPLPDKSLPSLTIRSELLKVLRRNFLHVTSETLKLSGIGKAVMLLYKHPKELRENKVNSLFT